MFRIDIIRRAALAAAFSALAACAGDVDLTDDDRPADEIFAEGERLVAEGDYIEAAERFDDVERLYPYSPLARDAVLNAARAYYQGRDLTEARLAAGRFLDFYPNDPDAAEAQYIVALSYYDLISDVGRDQRDTREALAALRELIGRYPDSEYAREATLRLDLARDQLAGKEMSVGRFYQGRGQLVAAINRFRSVIENYDTTTHTPEALHRLVECYLALGVVDEARAAAAVLGHNYRGSEWYERSYALIRDYG